MTVTAQPPREAVAAWGKQVAEARRHAYGHAVRDDGSGPQADNARTHWPRCPHCKMTPTVGVTVRIRHEPSCPRAGAAARRQAQAPTGQPPQRELQAAVPVPGRAAGSARPGGADGRAAGEPSETPVRPQRLEGCERHPHRRGRRHREREGVYTSQAPRTPAQAAEEDMRPGRIRPWVVLRWAVSGCRIAVQGWLATVRGVIRKIGGVLKVRLDFDDWPRGADDEIPEWWDLDDLLESAWAA